MNKSTLLKIVSFVLVSVILIAAAPQTQSDLVSLTIENRSNDYVTYQLQGTQHQFYYLTVKPYSNGNFTILRGSYTQKFYSCGAFVNTNLDLTKKQAIVVPPCGEKAYKVDKLSHLKVDGGQLIKLVKVTFTNETKVNLTLILSGTSNYVFFIKAGEEVSYTIAKGDYKIQQWGCTYFKDFNFYPYANKEKELTCPSW